MHSSTVELLRELPFVSRQSGLSPDEITDWSKRIGLPLPANMQALYRMLDGGTLKGGVEIVSLTEAGHMVQSMRQMGFPQMWGYLPFTENNDSNPLCLCCGGPLAGYIVRVRHDDDAELMFRSLENFLTALKSHLGSGGDFGGLPPEFLDPNRDERDLALARGLLRAAPTLGEVEQKDACRFALALLGEDQVEEIAALLDFPDEYVQEDALRRLTGIKHPAAAAVADGYNKQYREFAAKCVRHLTDAGIHAALTSDHGIRIESGPIGLNMKRFFAMRNDPGMLDSLLQAARR